MTTMHNANHAPEEDGIGDVHGELTQKVLAITQRSRKLHAELLDTVTQLRRETPPKHSATAT